MSCVQSFCTRWFLNIVFKNDTSEASSSKNMNDLHIIPAQRDVCWMIPCLDPWETENQALNACWFCWCLLLLEGLLQLLLYQPQPNKGSLLHKELASPSCSGAGEGSRLVTKEVSLRKQSFWGQHSNAVKQHSNRSALEMQLFLQD